MSISMVFITQGAWHDHARRVQQSDETVAVPLTTLRVARWAQPDKFHVRSESVGLGYFGSQFLLDPQDADGKIAASRAMVSRPE